MNLKLSYRDKVIFIVVMIIIVLVAGFFLLIKPKFEAVDNAKYNLEKKQAEWSEVEAKINTYPEIVTAMKESLDQIDEQQKIFLEEGHPYINERYIRDALAEVNVEVNSVTTEYTTASPINGYVVQNKNILAYDNKMNADLFNELPQEVYDQYNKVQKEGYPSTIIGVTTMNFTFSSDLELRDAFNVIDRIAEDEKTIILNTVGSSVEEVSDEPTQEITVDITMYSIYPLNVEKLREEPDTIEKAVEAAKKAAEEAAKAETPAAE